MIAGEPIGSGLGGPGWPPPRLCVLASGSLGNCTVLEAGPAGGRRICLVDAGLSPRRTRAMLDVLGLSLDLVTDVILTHLDHDHCHAGWAGAFPGSATLRLHTRHLGRAERAGLLVHRTETFECAPRGAFALPGLGAAVAPLLVNHDDLGVAAFRIEFPGTGSSLGFATDLGRVPLRLVEHLSGVDVLAIESNYCPRMQAASDRPERLKRRIMDGSGHISNEQCLDAIHAAGPREHVVLLHLSRQCNSPALVAALHAGADYALTISTQHEPTRWVLLPSRAPSPGRVAVAQMGLFA